MSSEPAPRTATSCLVNNYNYAPYVREAIDSALAQSVPFDEVIVVDDGSTDGSPELLRQAYSGETRVRVICKENGGQLSAMNDGFIASSGELLFFLDADDRYDPGYLAHALELYARGAGDFVFCAFRRFGERQGVESFADRDQDLGFTAVQTLVRHWWVGGPTSTLSMRRWVLDRILPLPQIEDWRTRADDCLVFGASLVGARKYYANTPLVEYRIHGANHYAGTSTSAESEFRRELAINRLFRHFVDHLGYSRERMADLAYREFLTIRDPGRRQLARYARIVLGCDGQSLGRRLRLIRYMIRAWLRGQGSTPPRG